MVFNESRDMLHVLKNFMEFFVDESCGQCTPCRIGNVKLLEGVEMIEKGEYTFAHINKLKDLGRTMQLASKCGLGQSSPESVSFQFLKTLMMKYSMLVTEEEMESKETLRAPVSQKSLCN